jgi:hypothetical protein
MSASEPTYLQAPAELLTHCITESINDFVPYSAAEVVRSRAPVEG